MNYYENVDDDKYEKIEMHRDSRTDLGGVVIGKAGVDGAGGGCGGCWTAGVVILEGGLTVGLAVLQTLGCEVMNHGGLGRDVVVVVVAENISVNIY